MCVILYICSIYSIYVCIYYIYMWDYLLIGDYIDMAVYYGGLRFHHSDFLGFCRIRIGSYRVGQEWIRIGFGLKGQICRSDWHNRHTMGLLR